GVKAIIATSFDRVHRSNLASIWIVPLCFTRHNCDYGDWQTFCMHFALELAYYDHGGMLQYIIRSLSNE
ncbi:unnamed protein product, partial [Brassica rapa subsp. trilocularis]